MIAPTENRENLEEASSNFFHDAAGASTEVPSFTTITHVPTGA